MTLRPPADVLGTRLDADFKAMLEQAGMLRAQRHERKFQARPDEPIRVGSRISADPEPASHRAASVVRLAPAAAPFPAPARGLERQVCTDEVDWEDDERAYEIRDAPRRPSRIKTVCEAAMRLAGPAALRLLRPARGMLAGGGRSLPRLARGGAAIARSLVRGSATHDESTKGGVDPVAASIKRHVRVGVGVTVLIAGSFALWAFATSLAGAVIAMGHLAVDSSVKAVQHPAGGVVAALNIRDGDSVRAGDVLMRLDDTSTKASLAVVTKAIDALNASRTRLLAERDNVDTAVFDDDLQARASDPSVARLMADEQRLFALRREESEGQKAQLRQRIDQLGQEFERPFRAARRQGGGNRAVRKGGSGRQGAFRKEARADLAPRRAGTWPRTSPW